MSYKPEKPNVKKAMTTEVWTKTADDRIQRIETLLENLEQRLKKLVTMMNHRKSSSSGYGYTVGKKS